MRKSISSHLGSTYSLKHNNREIMCANVDSTRSKNNNYFIMSNHIGTDGYRFATIEEIYNKIKDYTNILLMLLNNLALILIKIRQ